MDFHSPLDYSRDRSPDREPDKNELESARSRTASRFDPLLARMCLRQQMPLKRGGVPKQERAAEEVAGQSAKNSLPAPALHRSRPLDPPKRVRRENRSTQPSVALGLHIRPQERQLMLEVGRFRVITTEDLNRFIYKGNSAQLAQDLQFLKDKKLVECHTLNARRDGRSEAVHRFEAVTLTQAAKRLLEGSGEVPDGQCIYSGLVKAREAEHDAQIYRACRQELSAIEAEGGHNARVKLDFELKANLQRATHQARKAEPERELSEIKFDVAEQLNLPVADGKVVFPDARIEYELATGGSAQIDIEVATSAYRHGHIAAKSQAGFKIYISQGDIGRLGAAVQDDHDIMSAILEF